MSEIAIFGVGSIMFTMTTWATLAFGMQRIHEVQMRELETSDRISEVRSTGLTEIHLTIPPQTDDSSTRSEGA